MRLAIKISPVLSQKMPPAVHIHQDDLELYTRGQLELERIAIAESHLLECESCTHLLAERLGHRLALPIKAPESSSATRRREPRFSAEGEATAQELHPLSVLLGTRRRSISNRPQAARRRLSLRTAEAGANGLTAV
jgi:hypothetical protein